MVEAIPENMLINLVQLINYGYKLVIESNGERIAYWNFTSKSTAFQLSNEVLIMLIAMVVVAQ